MGGERAPARSVLTPPSHCHRGRKHSRTQPRETAPLLTTTRPPSAQVGDAADWLCLIKEGTVLSASDYREPITFELGEDNPRNREGRGGAVGRSFT